MKTLLTVAALVWGSLALAQDVVVIGEVHDNPAHHDFQAGKVAALSPAAIVFEMITAQQAEIITDEMRAEPEKLAKALNWAESGWPDFEMYAPIFAAAPEARIYGALVPGPGNPVLMTPALEQQLERLSQLYGLNRPLPPEMQKAREALQMEAHCNALPETVLPAMVDVQRLRDASLAEAARRAMHETGGPVAVITGNGHARPDWGMPALLREKAPELEVVAIGQTEDDQPLDGWFDQVISAPAADRPDPCLAFQ